LRFPVGSTAKFYNNRAGRGGAINLDGP